MRIDKLKKLLEELEAAPDDGEKVARLFRNLGDELPRDDFKKLDEIRAELARFEVRLRQRVVERDVDAPPGREDGLTPIFAIHFLTSGLTAVAHLLASYETAAKARYCELCEQRLLEYIVVDMAVETAPGKAERVHAKLCPGCGTDATHKGGRIASLGTYRKSPP